MELMEGQPLNQCSSSAAGSRRRRRRWVGQHAATGLALRVTSDASSTGDVKTANLFVTRESDRLKVMDSVSVEDGGGVRRRASLIAGSPSYMAPEQAQGLEVDGRAYLYAPLRHALELLTGRLPFEDGDPAHHHQNTPPPDPREQVAMPPRRNSPNSVVRLMAKQPECRPAQGGRWSRRKLLERFERELPRAKLSAHSSRGRAPVLVVEHCVVARVVPVPLAVLGCLRAAIAPFPSILPTHTHTRDSCP